MFGIGPPEMLIVGIVALLLFGSRLPEVARSLGKSLTEFKRGIQGVQDEFNSAVYEGQSAAQVDFEDDGPTAPKFEPPTTPPTDATTDNSNK